MAGLISAFPISVVVSALIVPLAASAGPESVQETVIYNFTGSNGDGAQPVGPLVAESGFDGRVDALYGVAAAGGSSAGSCALVDGCGTVYKLKRPERDWAFWQEISPLGAFQADDGATPAGGLVARRSLDWGRTELFGTTLYGGSTASADAPNSGYGTVFKLSDGELTTLWNFSGAADGQHPSGTLITDDAAGNPDALYGTTRGLHPPSYGTVFSIDRRTGRLSTIWSFSIASGTRPLGGLLADRTGALYGMTYKYGPNGVGTVFKLTPPGKGQSTWTEQTIWAFTGTSDGGNPEQPDPLVMDNSGALYGTAFTGGANNALCGSTGCGVVFKLIPPAHGQTAWTEQTVWTFTGGNDGGYPMSGVILDGAGALYGMTNGGGNSECVPFQSFESGCGVAYKLTPAGGGAWTLSTLWAFSGPPSDGANPIGALLADERGTLYGVGAAGGSGANGGDGAVFQLTGTGFLPRH
jgi:uncharacterized repeat protein (TIGR03803 family)